jgi:hypothetical protein
VPEPIVYFVRAGADGPIKIGFTSRDVAERISGLQTGCPWPIKLIGTISGSRADEGRLHEIFAAYRGDGEWFSAAQPLLDAIEALVAGTFIWPDKHQNGRVLCDDPSISDIIWAAGGPNAIAAASNGQLSVDAVHKWRRNGIRDWNWAILMSLCDVTAAQLLEANQAVVAPSRRRLAA